MNSLNGMQPLIYLHRAELEIQKLKANGDFEKVLNLYDSMIQIKQSFPNRLGLAKTVVDKAWVCEQIGDRFQALSLYQYAHQIANGSANNQFVHNIAQKIQSLQNN
jgi:tetratricopeptide (TPR) repeat protein